MKFTSIKTVYDFMQYCRMPLYFQRCIRDMEVGDTFILGKYTQPVTDDNEVCFIAEAWIEKKRGIYSFYGTWTFPTRALIMTSGKFKIVNGGIMGFIAKPAAVKSFALVCRYLAHLLSRMSIEDKQIYLKNNSIPLFNGLWLDSEFIEKRQRTVDVDGDIKRVNLCYRNYQPTRQLSAIVDAAFFLGVIPSGREGENKNE